MPIEPSDEENAYFLTVEAEARQRLREELEQNARRLAEQAKVGAALGTDDQALTAAIRDLGFDGETAAVFDLLPLVHVAWADGSIQKRERGEILGILAKRGIAPGSKPFQTIESLLEQRPSTEFMTESLALLRRVVGPAADRKDEIVDLCVKVATSSGRFFGLGGGISEAEKQMIAEVAQHLGQGAADKVVHQVED